MMRRRIESWARAVALVGGFALIGCIVVTLWSVIGAAIFGKPLLGDTEIVELLVGVAIACFMPYCQVRGAHVVVDFFTMKASPRTQRVLDAVMAIAFALVVAVLAERMVMGTLTQFERGRVSMFLQLPNWWGYVAASAAALLWTLVSFVSAWDKVRALAPDDRSATRQTRTAD